MVKPLVGNCPMDSACNVVTKLLEPGSSFEQVSVTTKMDGFAGCVVFAYLYNTVTHHHGLGDVDAVLDGIPDSTWTTFKCVLKQMLLKSHYYYRPLTLVTMSAKTSRERFFPHVAKLSKKLQMGGNVLYKEIVHDPEANDYPTNLSYTDITSYRRKHGAALSAVDKHMSQFHADLVGCGPTTPKAQGFEESQAPCQHKNVVEGRRKFCKECGLVLGSVFEYEPTFEKNVLVKHTSPEASWLPLNSRYTMFSNKNRDNKDTAMVRQDQKALRKNRRAFHARLLRIQMPPDLRQHFGRMWDLCVEMGFSPSGTKSAKAGSFSLRVVVMAYMVWRLVKPRHEHVFDFDILREKVQYLVVDDELAQSTTRMPTWYLPRKMQLNIPYDYSKTEYFGSDIVEDVVAGSKSPENRPSSPPVIQPTPMTRGENVKAWVERRAADFQEHFVQKPHAYVVRATKQQSNITPEEIERKVKDAIDKRVTRHGKHLGKVLTRMSPTSAKNPNLKAFDYKLNVDGSPVTYRVMNKENDPCFHFLPIEFDDNRNLRLDYGVQLKVRFTKANKAHMIEVNKMELCYKKAPCRQLRHKTNEYLFSLMEFTGQGDLVAVVTYTLTTKAQKKTTRTLRFSLDFSQVRGFKTQICTRLFGQKHLLDHTTPTGVFQATLTGLPLRLVGVSQCLNKYVKPLFSPVNAYIERHGSSFERVRTTARRSRKTKPKTQRRSKGKRLKRTSV